MNEQLLKAQNLFIGYGAKIFDKECILQNADICVKKGEFVCLCGKNGSGKSTLLKTLAGIEKNTLKKGKITLSCNFENSQTDLFSLKTKELAKRISFMEQTESSAWNQNVFDFILNGRYAWSNFNYTQEDFDIVEDSAKILNIKKLLDKDIYSISGGEFQKVRIARSLAQNTDFLLLDEPSSSLDALYENELLQIFLNLASQKNKGILISIHNINKAARFSQKIALITQKKIITDSPQNIFTKENLECAFGQGLKIFTHPIFNCPQAD